MTNSDSAPAGRAARPAAEESLIDGALADQLLAKAEAEGVELLGPDGLLSQVTKAVLERALGEELTEHLGYEKHDPAGRGSGNSRNGATGKRLLTEAGAVDLQVPRDWRGSFEPKIVRKGQTRLDGFNDLAIGIDCEGAKQVLGMWVGASTGESAKFWMSVLAELRNRGVRDVCILCCDGLSGLPEAATTVWPQVTVQLCVVHLIRASLRYASRKYWPALAKDLKAIYTASDEAAAAAALEAFAEQWEARYPAIVRLWRTHWQEFTPFLAFPPEVRRAIYTTNLIESLNARLRKVTRNRGQFPSEQAALKVLYLAVRNLEDYRTPNIGIRTSGWKQVLQAFTIYFEGRIPAP
ncbi:IS256 family transposase [Prauserella oleivorans]|uniref:Mutator family transposase n=2 Tax=Prauserella TaxID=142577 RepID=A0A318LMA2_9PSEU|nr:IS256 family transposase [Amycolatopsis albispora]PXY18367.1 hypothetical protein BAY59_34650 [Prauserella coralliicola]PXY25702.1 hypothetical protein BA062_26670 [Prauserella flavalba]